MALFKKIGTRAVPDGAKLSRRGNTWYAEWESRGKKFKERAKVGADGTARLVYESKTWYCRHRDASGRIREINTGCRDRGMAEDFERELARKREKISRGLITGTEAAAADWANVPLSTHIADYRADMGAKGLHPETIRSRVYYLETIARECRFQRFVEADRAAVERWLLSRVKEGMSARLHNAYLAAAIAFGNWALRQGRITANPFAGVQKRNEKADRRRVRRALSETEAAALIDAARVRPLHEAQHGNRGDGPANLKLETADALQWLGEVRAMAYRVMLGTGLRFGELRSITIGAACLDHEPPYLELEAKHEKARRGAQIPLSGALAADLGKYIAERKKRLAADSTPIHGILGERVFDLPEKMSRVFDRDLCFAGLAEKVKTSSGKKRIEKHDERGRVLDVHCLRHTFITMLARSGASLQVTQKAARHSDPRLTSNIYTHLRLDDIAGAVDTLPDFSGNIEVARAVQNGDSHLAAYLADQDDKNRTGGRQRLAIPGKIRGVEILSKPLKNARKNTEKSGVFDGRGEEIRTLDPLLPKQVR